MASRHGVTVVNAPGTIDSDYRGEIVVLLVNLGKEPHTLMPGDRVAQRGGGGAGRRVAAVQRAVGAGRLRPPRIVTRFPVNRRRVERIISRQLRSGRLYIGEAKAKDILEKKRRNPAHQGERERIDGALAFLDDAAFRALQNRLLQTVGLEDDSAGDGVNAVIG